MKFRFHLVADNGHHSQVALHAGEYPGGYCGAITMRNDEWTEFKRVLQYAGGARGSSGMFDTSHDIVEVDSEVKGNG